MTLIKFLNKPQFLQTTTNLNYDIDDAIKRCLITTQIPDNIFIDWYAFLISIRQ